MTGSFRLTMAAIILLSLGALAWISHTIDGQMAQLRTASEAYARALGPRQARSGGFGGLGGGFDPAEGPRVVHVRDPISAAEARTWLKLNKAVPMPFADETPLEDVLKHIKAAAQDEDGTTLAIYVDPIGLAEAEKTMQSPVCLDLDGLPLARSLTLILKQLGLTYGVAGDGLLIITSETSEDASMTAQEITMTQLERIDAQVQALRQEMAIIRAASGGGLAAPPGRRTSMGGSMTGGFGGGGLQ